MFLLLSLRQALVSQDHSFLTEIAMQVTRVTLNVLIHIEWNRTALNEIELNGMEWNNTI